MGGAALAGILTRAHRAVRGLGLSRTGRPGTRPTAAWEGLLTARENPEPSSRSHGRNTRPAPRAGPGPEFHYPSDSRTPHSPLIQRTGETKRIKDRWTPEAGKKQMRTSLRSLREAAQSGFPDKTARCQELTMKRHKRREEAAYDNSSL